MGSLKISFRVGGREVPRLGLGGALAGGRIGRGGGDAPTRGRCAAGRTGRVAGKRPDRCFFFAVTAVMGLFSAVRCLSVGVFSC